MAGPLQVLQSWPLRHNHFPSDVLKSLQSDLTLHRKSIGICWTVHLRVTSFKDTCWGSTCEDRRRPHGCTTKPAPNINIYIYIYTLFIFIYTLCIFIYTLCICVCMYIYIYTRPGLGLLPTAAFPVLPPGIGKPKAETLKDPWQPWHLGLKDDGVRHHGSAVLFAHLFYHSFAELQHRVSGLQTWDPRFWLRCLVDECRRMSPWIMNQNTENYKITITIPIFLASNNPRRSLRFKK